MGASVGRAEFDDLNCRSGFACERNDTAYKAFIGGQVRKGLGVELSYIDLGEGGANGGTTKVRGLNLSLIGNIPLGEQFNIYGKVGGTYGETRTSVSPLAVGVPSGDEDGFAVSYGAGVQLDFNRNWAARLEWDRYRFKYAESRQDSNLYSLGFLYKF